MARGDAAARDLSLTTLSSLIAAVAPDDS